MGIHCFVIHMLFHVDFSCQCFGGWEEMRKYTYTWVCIYVYNRQLNTQKIKLNLFLSYFLIFSFTLKSYLLGCEGYMQKEEGVYAGEIVKYLLAIIAKCFLNA